MYTGRGTLETQDPKMYTWRWTLGTQDPEMYTWRRTLETQDPEMYTWHETLRILDFDFLPWHMSGVGQTCAWSQLAEIDSDSAKKKLGLIPIPFPAEHCHAESIPTAIPVN